MKLVKPRERPILMAPEMAAALRRGEKVQTRRMVKWKYRENAAGVEPIDHVEVMGGLCEGFAANLSGTLVGCADAKCRYGVLGDLLWVKEAWRIPGDCGRDKASDCYCTGPSDIEYRADYAGEELDIREWRSSLFMPRWASRSLLEMLSIRVERMGDISEADAVAEGFKDRAAFIAYAFARNKARNRKLGITMEGFLASWTWVLGFKLLEGGA